MFARRPALATDHAACGDRWLATLRPPAAPIAKAMRAALTRVAVPTLVRRPTATGPVVGPGAGRAGLLDEPAGLPASGREGVGRACNSQGGTPGLSPNTIGGSTEVRKSPRPCACVWARRSARRHSGHVRACSTSSRFSRGEASRSTKRAAARRAIGQPEAARSPAGPRTKACANALRARKRSVAAAPPEMPSTPAISSWRKPCRSLSTSAAR